MPEALSRAVASRGGSCGAWVDCQRSSWVSVTAPCEMTQSLPESSLWVLAVVAVMVAATPAMLTLAIGVSSAAGADFRYCTMLISWPVARGGAASVRTVFSSRTLRPRSCSRTSSTQLGGLGVSSARRCSIVSCAAAKNATFVGDAESSRINATRRRWPSSNDAGELTRTGRVVGVACTAGPRSPGRLARCCTCWAVYRSALLEL